MESKGGPAGVFPHSKFKPSSIHISQQSQESTTGTGTSTTLQAPLTPRIDISRASSSSYHEDSSPENVFDQVGTGTLQEASGCLELFQEDADELRSSTEELFFMEKEKGQTECEKPSSAQVPRAPMIFKFDESQTLQQLTQYNRKDSGSSEVAAFLNPSGRTSRISSVGSQGSAVSRLSGASGISRSPSPHKMLVETSFCGPKPIEPTSDAGSIEQLTADIESVILARRGDPTRVALAEGVEVKESVMSAVKPPKKTTKEKIQEISNTSMTPAESARAAAKEQRRKEIEALKVRLNAINQKQLEKSTKSSGLVKKVIGVTPEGTEYTRIKLKPDHLYEDNGISPNEKVIEEKEFTDPLEKKKERLAKKEESNQLSRKSPSAHATDNRSPSPASTSVSRKSSFCSFFKSKDPTAGDTTKSKSSTIPSGKNKLNDKSPIPSPSKSSFSSRIALTLFKSNRNPSPSQLIEPSSSVQEGSSSKKISSQSQQKSSMNQKDKPRLRYYDTPDVIFIPLHTPPEEKEFSALKKTSQDVVVVEKKDVSDVIVIAAQDVEKKTHTQSQITSHNQTILNIKPKIAPTAQIEKMQSTDELELQELPNRKVIEDRDAGSSLWSVEVQRHSSQESQETVISSQPKHDNIISKNGIPEKPVIPSFIDTINENQPLNQQQKGRHKKHILFSTKIGSGSEEQIFSTQLSLSKTESQSSQLSEQASVFESPKNEECGTKVQEVTRNTMKHQSSSEVEKVTATSVRSRSDQSDSGSRPQSVTRKQRSSGEFSKKRESSEELLHKMPRDTSKEIITPQVIPQYQQASPTSYEPQTTQTINENVLHHQSSGSRMEISSESDRESDIDGCIHKRVSRLMEDHESAGLVLQESFDDELPYVPTTLPEERSSGIKIIPTKERTQSELITIPLERPRSTTPIHPTSLDNFCEKKPSDITDANLIRGEKLRISLPRHKPEQSKEKVQQKAMTRRTSNLSNKSWTEFAEQGIQNTCSKKTERTRKESNSSQDGEQHNVQQHQPPVGPIVKSHSKKSLTSKWIDFENIPEKRQQPKKITTIPLNKDMPSEKIHNSKHSHHQRHYVSPEECQCECHESKKDGDNKQSVSDETGKTPSDDSQPLIDDNVERHSTMSTDSSLDCSLENDESNDYLLQQSSNHTSVQNNRAASNNNLDKPFGMDLSVEFGGHSNRSSIISQDIKSPDLHK
ncbi:uncharacterized protein [Chironomus tepperi]|uniref:uncharacterized protein isoform X2 n=1 Tax=Chironomus tepperi TaxID=113505 RepID=UPI00391FAC6E